MHWISKILACQLLVCYCVILEMKGHFTFLPPQIIGQQFISASRTMLWALIVGTCEMLELEDWEPNKLRTQLWSKENFTSSKVVTSFWIKSVPS